MINFFKKFKSKKKSQTKEIEENIENFIMYYVENGELKIKFAFDDINEFSNLAESVLNGKVRDSSFETIKLKLIDNGFMSEALVFSYLTSSYIKPSEYAK